MSRPQLKVLARIALSWSRARAAAEAFVARHRDGLARLLQDDILCVAEDQAPRGAPTLL